VVIIFFILMTYMSEVGGGGKRPFCSFLFRKMEISEKGYFVFYRGTDRFSFSVPSKTFGSATDFSYFFCTEKRWQ